MIQRDYSGEPDWGWTIVVWMFVSFAIAFVGFFGWIIFGWDHDPDWQAVNVPLVALSDSGSVGGQFWLGCGTLESGLAYYYYERQSNVIAGRTISASLAVLAEDEDDAPYITYWRPIPSQDAWPWQCWVDPNQRPPALVFHIPPNSVLVQYKMDLR